MDHSTADDARPDAPGDNRPQVDPLESRGDQLIEEIKRSQRTRRQYRMPQLMLVTAVVGVVLALPHLLELSYPRYFVLLYLALLALAPLVGWALGMWWFRGDARRNWLVSALFTVAVTAPLVGFGVWENGWYQTLRAMWVLATFFWLFQIVIIIALQRVVFATSRT